MICPKAGSQQPQEPCENLLNPATTAVFARFDKAALNGMQISPNNYVTLNVRFMSVERTI